MILERFPDQETFLELAEKYNVIPVCTRILADMETPVSILQKFHDKKKQSFLLESVEGGERWARYSFLGLNAYGSLKVLSNHVEIRTGEQTRVIEHENDPLNVIREFTADYHPADIPDLPRFWSGLTGYCTYEIVSFFEDIPVSLPEETPYAHFMIPDEMIIFDNVQQTLTCLQICYLERDTDPETAFGKARDGLEKMLATLSTPFTPKTRAPAGPIELKAETPPEIYKERVEKIKHHIVEGDIFQAVYSQPFTCDTDVDPIRIYRRNGISTLLRTCFS